MPGTRPGTTPSGRLFARRLGRQDLNRTAGLLYRRHGRFRRAPHRKRHFGLDLATAEKPHSVLLPPQHAGFDQRCAVDLGRSIEPAGVDRLLHAAEIYLIEFAGEFDVAEAAFGQPPVQRHLTALEAFDAHAGARGLALAAAAAGLAGAGADAAADALSHLAGAGTAGEIGKLHGLVLHDFDEVGDLGDHAAGLRRIDQLGDTADLVEPKPDEGFALRMIAAHRAAGLPHFDGLACPFGAIHWRAPRALDQSAGASASTSRRRACSAETLTLRRAATERGESWRLSASKVARTTLYGFEVPSDFATTSCMPSVSNTARIGPPAMMPVPGGAARRKTLPAPWRPATS